MMLDHGGADAVVTEQHGSGHTDQTAADDHGGDFEIGLESYAFNGTGAPRGPLRGH
jgi:hypothetical protein